MRDATRQLDLFDPPTEALTIFNSTSPAFEKGREHDHFVHVKSCLAATPTAKQKVGNQNDSRPLVTNLVTMPAPNNFRPGRLQHLLTLSSFVALTPHEDAELVELLEARA